jgi:GTP cyclohydrolase I
MSAKFPSETPAGESSGTVPADVVEAIRTMLRWIGEDPGREGLRETPGTVARALRSALSGHREGVMFDVRPRAGRESGGPETIVLRNAPFDMIRETDLARVTGMATVAYLPDAMIAEASALRHALTILARRLQTQERLTADFAEAIWDRLSPTGVAVIIETTHVDLVTGMPATDLAVTTRIMLGRFRDDPEMRRAVAALMGPGPLASWTRAANASLSRQRIAVPKNDGRS